MRPDRELHFAPGEVKVGVMSLRFGQLADLVCKRQGIPEVLKLVLLFEMMLVHHAPMTSEISGKPRQGVSLEFLNFPFAWFALLFRKCCHKSCPFVATSHKTCEQSRSCAGKVPG